MHTNRNTAKKNKDIIKTINGTKYNITKIKQKLAHLAICDLHFTGIIYYTDIIQYLTKIIIDKKNY